MTCKTGLPECNCVISEQMRKSPEEPEGCRRLMAFAASGRSLVAVLGGTFCCVRPSSTIRFLWSCKTAAIRSLRCLQVLPSSAARRPLSAASFSALSLAALSRVTSLSKSSSCCAAPRFALESCCKIARLAASSVRASFATSLHWSICRESGRQTSVLAFWGAVGRCAGIGSSPACLLFRPLLAFLLPLFQPPVLL